MTRWAKILFGTSLALLILSYPACQIGEQKVHTEMANYSAEFVAAHEFDIVFFRWVLPGIWMFNSGVVLALVSITAWLVTVVRRKSAV
jgi:hypothetical protein